MLIYNPQTNPTSPVDVDVAGHRFGFLRAEYRRGHDIACRCVCDKLVHIAAAALADGLVTSADANRRRRRFVPTCATSSPSVAARPSSPSRGRARAVAIAHPSAVRGLDFNETPACATLALMRAEALPKRLWEPSAGRGAIARELRAAGHVVTTSDIVARDFELYFVADFLTTTEMPAGCCTAIATNPPHSRAVLDPFVRHALDLSPRVYLLLRLSFLEGTGRSDILESRGLARVQIFRDRLPLLHRDIWQPDREPATSSRSAGSCGFATTADPPPSIASRPQPNHRPPGR